MAVPSPRTWTPGELITAAYMNGLRDALNFLLNPPIGRCTFTTPPSIGSSAAYTALGWDTETYDTDNAHTVGGTTITPPTPGYYTTVGAVAWPGSNTTGIRRAAVALNGTLIAASLLNDPAPNAANFAICEVRITQLLNGTTDNFDVRASQTSGGALTLGSSTPVQSFVEWQWEHAA